MNTNFLELTRDNLGYFLDTPKIVVIFTSPACGSCKKILPKLKELSAKIPIVNVNALLFDKALTFYPEEIKFYPTIAYYENGDYIKTIKNKTLWVEMAKLIKQ